MREIVHASAAPYYPLSVWEQRKLGYKVTGYTIITDGLLQLFTLRDIKPPSKHCGIRVEGEGSQHALKGVLTRKRHDGVAEVHYARRGSRAVKTAPRSPFAAVTLPPYASTMACTMANPKPV